MKSLPPALRDKYRYLKFEIHSEEDVELGEVVNQVWSHSLEFLGSKGCSKTDLWVIGNQFDQENQQGIVRVKRDMEEDFRAALSTVDSFNGEKGFVEVKKVSGSIKKLKDN